MNKKKDMEAIVKNYSITKVNANLSFAHTDDLCGTECQRCGCFLLLFPPNGKNAPRAWHLGRVPREIHGWARWVQVFL